LAVADGAVEVAGEVEEIGRAACRERVLDRDRAALGVGVGAGDVLAGGDVVARRGGAEVARAIGVRALDLGQIPAGGDVLGGRVAPRLHRLRAVLLAVADGAVEVAGEVEGRRVPGRVGHLLDRDRAALYVRDRAGERLPPIRGEVDREVAVAGGARLVPTVLLDLRDRVMALLEFGGERCLAVHGRDVLAALRRAGA